MIVNDRSCVLCQEGNVGLFLEPERSPGPLVRCFSCGMVYVSPIQNGHALITEGPLLGDLDPRILTSVDIRDINGCWELSALPIVAAEWPIDQINAAAALNEIEKYKPPPGHLLDFGCGWGFFLGAAKERGWSIYGLEPLPAHAVYARAKFGASVVTDILRKDSFPPSYFDVVTAFQVFEHLPDPAGDLAKLYHILKPGGVIYIEVPDIDTFGVRLLKARHRHFVQDHLNFFSPCTLSLLLEKNNFRVKKIYHPTRHMSIRHVVNSWIARYTPNGIANLFKVISQKLGLAERIISINLHDILTVIAIKY